MKRHGASSATCDKNARWSNPPPQCLCNTQSLLRNTRRHLPLKRNTFRSRSVLRGAHRRQRRPKERHFGPIRLGAGQPNGAGRPGAGRRHVGPAQRKSDAGVHPTLRTNTRTLRRHLQ